MLFPQKKRFVAGYTRGFNLLETVIVISLFTVVLLVVTDSISLFYKHNAYSIAQANQISNARRGIDSLVRDIREMTYADDGSYPLVTNATHTMAFYSDIDRDNSVEYVEYELIASTTLVKRVYNATGSPPQYDLSAADETYTLSEYVQNINQATSTFEYYTDSGTLITPTSTVTDIRYITVQLIVNIDPIRDPGEFRLRSSAAPRNLKQNF